MKRIVKLFDAKIPPLRLHVEDIEEIVDLLALSGWNVCIQTPDHVLDNPNELSLIKEEVLYGLVIEGRRQDGVGNDGLGAIRLDFHPNSSRLSTNEASHEAWGLCAKIQAVLVRSKLKLGWLTHSLWVMLIVCIPFLLFSDYLRTLIPYFSAGSAIVFLLWGSLVFFNTSKRHSVIVLKHRVDTPSFWKRNSDKILVAAVTAVLVSPLTLLMNGLASRLKSNDAPILKSGMTSLHDDTPELPDSCACDSR